MKSLNTVEGSQKKTLHNEGPDDAFKGAVKETCTVFQDLIKRFLKVDMVEE